MRDMQERRTDRFAMKVRAAQRDSRTERQYQADISSLVYQALLSTGIFGRTDPSVVSAFSRQLQPVHFAPGHAVATEGDFGGRLYVIISGKVKVSYRRPDGREMLLTIVGPAEFLGATAMFDPASRRATASTLTQVLAVPIERQQLLAWMVEHPEIRDQLLRLLARWARLSTTFLNDFASADSQKRVAGRLLFLGQRFGRREGEVVRVVHDLTSDDFSRLVDVATETIGATLRNFEHHGWIHLDDKSFLIADSQALRSLRDSMPEGDEGFDHRHSA